MSNFSTISLNHNSKVYAKQLAKAYSFIFPDDLDLVPTQRKITSFIPKFRYRPNTNFKHFFLTPDIQLPEGKTQLVSSKFKYNSYNYFNRFLPEQDLPEGQQKILNLNYYTKYRLTNFIHAHDFDDTTEPVEFAESYFRRYLNDTLSILPTGSLRALASVDETDATEYLRRYLNDVVDDKPLPRGRVTLFEPIYPYKGKSFLAKYPDPVTPLPDDQLFIRKWLVDYIQKYKGKSFNFRLTDIDLGVVGLPEGQIKLIESLKKYVKSNVWIQRAIEINESNIPSGRIEIVKLANRITNRFLTYINIPRNMEPLPEGRNNTNFNLIRKYGSLPYIKRNMAITAISDNAITPMGRIEIVKLIRKYPRFVVF